MGLKAVLSRYQRQAKKGKRKEPIVATVPDHKVKNSRATPSGMVDHHHCVGNLSMDGHQKTANKIHAGGAATFLYGGLGTILAHPVPIPNT